VYEYDEDELEPELDPELVEAEGADPVEVARRAAMAGEGLANSAYFLGLAHEAARQALVAAERLRVLEERLVLVDRMLRVSQPPVPGKLGVRWWSRRGHDLYRRPVLVSWHPLRNGRWRSRAVAQVRRDRISRDGTAAMNAEMTYHLALAASRLIKAYSELARDLAKGGRELNKAHARTDALLRSTNATLRVSHRSVTKKLEAAGYEIDRATMTLLDGHDLA